MSKEVSMRKALTLIVAATLLVTCTACANDGTDNKPKSQCTNTGHNLYTCEVPQVNGKKVRCVIYGVHGGVSCDWNE